MHEELFQTLHQDHEEVRTVFARLKTEGGIAERTRLLFQLQNELLPHMLAEEKVLYPRLQAEAEVEQEALESIAEHRAVRLVLRDLTETPANEQLFTAKVRVLEEMVEHHIGEEEGEIFREMRQHLSADEADQILRRFREEKENVPCGPGGRGWML